MNNLYKLKNKKGYVVITTALILLVVSLGIAGVLSFLSTGSAKSSQSFERGEQELSYSDSCVEEALLRLKTDLTYIGGTINFPEGQCKIGIELNSDTYTVRAYFLGQENYLRSIEAKIVIIDGILQIISWEEKPFVVN